MQPKVSNRWDALQLINEQAGGDKVLNDEILQSGLYSIGVGYFGRFHVNEDCHTDSLFYMTQQRPNNDRSPQGHIQ